MPFTDLLIYFLGIYGLSWFFVNAIILDKIREPFLTYLFNKNNAFFHLLYKMFRCISCVSFWISFLFVGYYFPAEIFLTKTLVVFASFGFVNLVSLFTEKDY